MKRLSALILALLLCLSLCACSENAENKSSGDAAYVGEWKERDNLQSTGSPTELPVVISLIRL